jgi:hypothetical protein
MAQTENPLILSLTSQEQVSEASEYVSLARAHSEDAPENPAKWGPLHASVPSI